MGSLPDGHARWIVRMKKRCKKRCIWYDTSSKYWKQRVVHLLEKFHCKLIICIWNTGATWNENQCISVKMRSALRMPHSRTVQCPATLHGLVRVKRSRVCRWWRPSFSNSWGYIFIYFWHTIKQKKHTRTPIILTVLHFVQTLRDIFEISLWDSVRWLYHHW